MRWTGKIVAAGLLASSLLAPPATAASVGKPAPKFYVVTYDGRKITSEQMKGQVVVLNYWATWCGPCRIELPTLDAYLRSHVDSGLVIYAVATEGSVPEAKLKPLAAALSFPLISHLSAWGYGPIGGAVPTNYVIDRSGVVRYAKAGAFDAAELDTVLGPLLAQPAPAVAAAP